MRVEEYDQENRRLVLKASAAEVSIIKASVTYPDTKGWIVDWEVVESVAYDEKSSGRRHFSDIELRRAFGLVSISDGFEGWLFNKYGAEYGEQGKYIRWRRYLNIPGPGTGHDGDPNVSIEIDETIREAVKKMLA